MQTFARTARWLERCKPHMHEKNAFIESAPTNRAAVANGITTIYVRALTLLVMFRLPDRLVCDRDANY